MQRYTHLIMVLFNNGEEKTYRFKSYKRALKFRKFLYKFHNEFDILVLGRIFKHGDKIETSKKYYDDYLDDLLKLVLGV